MTGTTVARSQDAQTYLDRVGAALADLPEEERADLLDELGTHVDEIAAEGTSSLEARLGSPEDYAAELRASAGLPPARARGRAVVDVLGRIQQARRRPDLTAVEHFLVALRPVWWVARAWVVVAMLTWFAQPHWLRSLAVVPDLGSAAVSVIVLVAAVVVSVQAGRRGRLRTAPGRWLVTAVNVAALIALWPVLLTVNEAVLYGTQTYYVGDPKPQIVEQPPAEGVYSGGSQVWNIYPYDAAGRMLHGVRLYDQDGNPLSLGLAFDPTKQQTLDAAGQKVDNSFPYRYLDPTTGEVADPEAAPPIVAPPLLGVPAATPAAPAATASPAPTSGKQ
jgi:hypothetical protein